MALFVSAHNAIITIDHLSELCNINFIGDNMEYYIIPKLYNDIILEFSKCASNIYKHKKQTVEYNCKRLVPMVKTILFCVQHNIPLCRY